MWPWVACLFGFPALMALLFALGTDKGGPRWVAAALLVPAAFAFDRYRRADAHGAAMIAFVGSFVLALITGAMWLYGSHPYLLTQALALGSPLAGVGLGVWFYRQSRRPDPLPNPLVARFERPAILELDGVQFVVVTPTGGVRPGEGASVTLEAQNGWDAERTVRLELVPERRISLSGGRFGVPSPCELSLPPGGYGAIEARIVAPVDTPGRHPVEVRVWVTGSGGRRIRTWRATAYTRAWPVWLRLLAALAGNTSAGQGFVLQFEVPKGEPSDQPFVPWASAELRWVPDDAVLEAARSAQ